MYLLFVRKEETKRNSERKRDNRDKGGKRGGGQITMSTGVARV